VLAVEAGDRPNIDGQYFLLLCLHIPVPSHISYFDLVCGMRQLRLFTYSRAKLL